MSKVRITITLNARLYGWCKWAAVQAGCHNTSGFLSQVILEAISSLPSVSLERPAPRLVQYGEEETGDAISDQKQVSQQ